jgi:hypothetical protein
MIFFFYASLTINIVGKSRVYINKYVFFIWVCGGQISLGPLEG